MPSRRPAQRLPLRRPGNGDALSFLIIQVQARYSLCLRHHIYPLHFWSMRPTLLQELFTYLHSFCQTTLVHVPNVDKDLGVCCFFVLCGERSKVAYLILSVFCRQNLLIKAEHKHKHVEHISLALSLSSGYINATNDLKARHTLAAVWMNLCEHRHRMLVELSSWSWHSYDDCY